MWWMRFVTTAAVLACGATALGGCGSEGNGQQALFAGGNGYFGESPAKPGLYDDRGWPIQPAAAKVAADRGDTGTSDRAR